MLILLLVLILPPNIDQIARLNCRVSEITEPDGYHRWHLRVYATYRDGTEWLRDGKLLSIRESRKKSLLDCDDWIEDVQRSIREARKK